MYRYKVFLGLGDVYFVTYITYGTFIPYGSQNDPIARSCFFFFRLNALAWHVSYITY